MAPQRQTKQLQAIRSAFEESPGPLSIDELHTLAREPIDSLGLRTVYRIVRRLQEEGEIASVQVPGKSDRYELASVASSHHHHFHCTACDRYFDIEGCPGGLESLFPTGSRSKITTSRCPAAGASCADGPPPEQQAPSASSESSLRPNPPGSSPMRDHQRETNIRQPSTWKSLL